MQRVPCGSLLVSLRLGIRRNCFTGKVVKYRRGLLREESPSLEWMWHSLLWVGIAHRLDSMVLELFST